MFLYKRTYNKQKGFTLVELLVSVSIIAIMSTLFFVNYRQGGVGVDLNAAANSVASKIRVAQNYSLGTKKFNNLTPLGGWGVHIDYENYNNQYIMFADIDGDFTYDLGEGYSTSTLPINVVFSSMTKASPVDIVFLPPDPRTFINTEDNQALTITLQEVVNNTTNGIEINFLGLIDVTN